MAIVDAALEGPQSVSWICSEREMEERVEQAVVVPTTGGEGSYLSQVIQKFSSFGETETKV